MGGRLLATPENARVRPTADKVRQAVFNILAHRDFGIGIALDGVCAIDLFAGTGALGLEALSRGARYCLFVDNDAESRALIRVNVEALALTGVTKIWRRDASDLGPMAAGAGGPFALAFLDPPYRQGLIGPALASLRDGRWLAAHAIAVAERAGDEAPAAVSGFALFETRSYGDTAIDFLRFEI